MGLDGYAAGGTARPGCHCKACELTNTDHQHAGLSRMDGYEETSAPLHAQRTAREWETLRETHEGLNAGLYGPPTMNNAGVAT